MTYFSTFHVSFIAVIVHHIAFSYIDNEVCSFMFWKPSLCLLFHLYWKSALLALIKGSFHTFFHTGISSSFFSHAEYAFNTARSQLEQCPHLQFQKSKNLIITSPAPSPPKKTQLPQPKMQLTTKESVLSTPFVFRRS